MNTKSLCIILDPAHGNDVRVNVLQMVLTKNIFGVEKFVKS